MNKIKSQQSFSLGLNVTTLHAITYNEALSLTRSIKEKVTSNETLITASLPANFTAQINTDISTPFPIVQPTPILDTTTSTSTTTTTDIKTTTTSLLTSIPDTTISTSIETTTDIKTTTTSLLTTITDTTTTTTILKSNFI